MNASLGDYVDADAREAALDALAGSHPGTSIVEYGRSVEGRPLRALRVPSNGGAQKVLVCGNIHGVEWISARVVLALASQVVASSGEGAPLRQAAECWFIPCLNPDGYARTEATSGSGTVGQLRTNAHGVDLNRNFPRPGNVPPSRLPFTGTDNPRGATYRGPSALSEPETAALDKLLGEQKFHSVTSGHSFMGTFIPARVTDARIYDAYTQLCAGAFAKQRHARYRRMGSRLLDAFTGELEDHAHHVHDAWACTVEHFPVPHSIAQHLRAPSTFWRFNPRDAARYVENDVPAIVAFHLGALALPRPSAFQGADAQT